MQPLIQLLLDHSTITLFAGYFVFNAFVAGMPDPRPNSSVGYEWTFKSLHALALNLNVFWQKRGIMPPPTPAPGETLAASQVTDDGRGATTKTTVVATAAPAVTKEPTA